MRAPRHFCATLPPSLSLYLSWPPYSTSSPAGSTRGPSRALHRHSTLPTTNSAYIFARTHLMDFSCLTFSSRLSFFAHAAHSTDPLKESRSGCADIVIEGHKLSAPRVDWALVTQDISAGDVRYQSADRAPQFFASPLNRQDRASCLQPANTRCMSVMSMRETLRIANGHCVPV